MTLYIEPEMTHCPECGRFMGDNDDIRVDNCCQLVVRCKQCYYEVPFVTVQGV